MARLFVQYLADYNIKNLPYSNKKLAKVGCNVCQILSKSTLIKNWQYFNSTLAKFLAIGQVYIVVNIQMLKQIIWPSGAWIRKY